ncbi:CPBP family intramembrane glutamic endopeptidase [Microbacterium luticocti]|uniref:CPBP family intramembrane glutamic endopeptidase n=1 Tax=Microbacterium luticocti TaxID=451764 RepID=UPI00048F02B0|nr:CPBP family intramembrane glutamic endopeptidase [Microbacterium luticocti]
MTRAPLPRARLWWEVGLVLACTLGQSAVYSVLQLVRRLLAPVPLGAQQTQLNPTQSPEPVWDIVYQLLDIAFSLALVGLVLYLLWDATSGPFRRIGLDLTRPLRDLGAGAAIALIIGIPGLGLYALGRVLGITVQVAASPLDPDWWTIPLLVLSAVRAGLQEEVIMIGYLFARLRQAGWNGWTIILASAMLRGAYHAYQGIGPIVGNFVMGVVFGWCYRRWGRVMPLVVAHTILDVVSFVGYPLAAAWWPGVFAPAPAGTPTPSPTAS